MPRLPSLTRRPANDAARSPPVPCLYEDELYAILEIQPRGSFNFYLQWEGSYEVSCFPRRAGLWRTGGAIAGILLATAGDALQAMVRERYNEVMDEGRRAAAERRAELEAQFAEAKRAPRLA